MTKNQKSNNSVGDNIMPPLAPTPAALRDAANQANTILSSPARETTQASQTTCLANAIDSQIKNGASAANCNQHLWFSFFFDGTGNNLKADVGTKKHSNVAKLFSVHRENDQNEGTYRIYIPGVGTYFKEVGDDGGSTLGLGTGDKGDVRIDWAIGEFDRLLAPHSARSNNSSNPIIEISISAFGFSRGAALARAFITELLKRRCKEKSKGNWRTIASGSRLRVRFLGLFDTVASVGMPMSSNTTSVGSTVRGSVEKMIKDRMDTEDVTPLELAFEENAQPGADPAPGSADGHASWGGKMAIHDMVEEVRHYIAAHELRNSFPVESVFTNVNGKLTKPTHFYESVYPGVHSDVGGSYRPGEGARSNLAFDKLGLLPLKHMYEDAMAAGVPLVPRTAWTSEQGGDFKISAEVITSYTYYMSKIPKHGTVGVLMNAHMALYYAWRFRSIKRKAAGDHSEEKMLERNEAAFHSEHDALSKEIKRLQAIEGAAYVKTEQLRYRRRAIAQSAYGGPKITQDLAKVDSELKDADNERSLARDALLRTKAKRDALPSFGKMQDMITFYDAQLLKDAETIYAAYAKSRYVFLKPDTEKRRELRPHYQVLMNAYENEYIKNKGLADPKIIEFFDKYVHDSLSGFAKDATTPSDPRVVYVGGDEKLKYANNELPSATSVEQAYA